jgi:hypothetical protein
MVTLEVDEVKYIFPSNLSGDRCVELMEVIICSVLSVKYLKQRLYYDIFDY